MISYHVSGAPFTTDPLEYDALVHHEAFGSVYASLVSLHKKGGFQPILAEKWTVSNDRKTWTFFIRPHIFFENGDAITAKTIIDSWKRMIFLQNMRGSESQFFKNLVGIHSFHKMSDDILGLKADGPKLTIRLSTPIERFLEIISFGNYAVVHPNDYDATSGIWKNPHKITSSSFYKIQSWSSDSIELELKEKFLPELRHPLAFKKISLVWGETVTTDIASGDSISNFPNDYTFHGSSPSAIAFIRIYSWKDKNSPLSSLEMRKYLREKFYQSMETHGQNITTSFFNPVMAGTDEMPREQAKAIAFESPRKINFALTLRPHNRAMFLYNNAMKETLTQNQIAGKEIKVKKPQEVYEMFDEDKSPHNIDISAAFTTILIENPFDDIKFMFLSKEGLCFPDADGRIKTELAKNTFSPQKINQLMWEQAIIWPITHFALGLWSKDFIDLSQLNLLLPPMHFAYIGAKT